MCASDASLSMALVSKQRMVLMMNVCNTAVRERGVRDVYIEIVSCKHVACLY
jgi:hypothetical protein